MASLIVMLFALAWLGSGYFFVSGFRCPGHDWYYRKGTDKCYYVMGKSNNNDPDGFHGGLSGSNTFNYSIEACRALGGKILVLEDSEELSWLTAKISGSYSEFWIGLTYENNQWEWTDGDTFKPYTAIPGLNVQPPTNRPELQRGILNYIANRTFQGFIFKADSRQESNGFVCKGDWSGRPWCKTEEGYVYHDGRCFRPVYEPSGFVEAEAQCLADGGYLPVPRTAAINSRLAYWFRAYFKVKQTWLGIKIWNKTDLVTADNLHWMDGTPMKNTSADLWRSHPDSYVRDIPNGENYCGEYTTQAGYYGGPFGFIWIEAIAEWAFTTDCTSPRPYVCESPLNKCPCGWHQSGAMCYQINLGDESLKNWTNAQATCRQKGGELVAIQDASKNIYIADLIWKYGIHDWEDGTQHEYYWIGLKGSNNGYIWPDGSATNYTDWYSQVQPANDPNMCAYIAFDRSTNATGSWQVTQCTQPQGFICEAHYTADIQPEEVVISAHTCEAPFVFFHEGCFLAVADEKTYDEASQDCISKQSRLAIIRNRGENAFLSGTVTKDSWIGMRVSGPDTTGFASGFQYSYSNGDIAGAGFYQDFADIFDITVEGSSDQICVAIAGPGSSFQYGPHYLIPDRGEWYHTNCNLTRGYVCWHEGTPIEAPVTEDPSDPYCGAGWFRHGPHCYQVMPEASTWRSAKATCRKMSNNADLVWFTTQEEESFVRTHLQRHYSHIPHSVWINLYTEQANAWHIPYRDYGNGNEDFLPFAVSNWAEGQPTPDTEVDGPYYTQCARITSISSGTWVSSHCIQWHASICKKTIEDLVTPAPTTALPSLAPDQQLGCPPHWHAVTGRCVWVSVIPADWATASQACRNEGGYLTDFRDESEFMYFKEFFIGSWIGLNSITAPSNPRAFTWSSGAVVTYLHWDIQSPNSHGVGAWANDTNCAAISPGGVTVYPCHERKPYVCEKEMIPVTGSATVEIPHSRGCLRWGVGFHESCYYFGQDPSTSQIGTKPLMDFDSARAFCRQHFGATADLVILNDGAEEREFINAHIARTGEEYWIGLREDREPRNAFRKWVDGSSVGSTNWAFGQPALTNDGFKGCVAMHGSMAEHGTIMPGDWYVTACTERKVALCKADSTFHPSHPTTNPSTPSPNGCPQGWSTKPEIGTCFKSYRGDQGNNGIHKLPWHEAENFCRQFKGGHLASINSEAEQSTVYALVNGDMNWIGLRQNPNAQNRWEWSDGKGLTTANWHAEISHTNPFTSNCVGFRSSGQWVPQSCDLGNGWLCEVPKDVYYPGQIVEEFPTGIPINHTCGTSSSEGAWYFDSQSEECVFISLRTDSWDNAQATCESINTNLITVTSTNYPFLLLKIAQTITSNTFSNGQDYWIGLRMTDFANKEYGWVDGYTSFFRPWDANEPNGRGTERCVCQNSVSGKWRDHNCARNLYFICAKTNRIRPVTTPSPVGGNCRTGWTENGDNCYYLSKNENKTWQEAHQACVQLVPGSSDLASIHSSIENDFIVTKMKGQHDRGYWIGLHEVPVDTYSFSFVWSDQSPIRYNNWHFSEPLYEYSTSRDRAIEIRGDHNRAGKWQVLKADQTRDYICKAKKDPSAPAQPVTNNCRSGYSQLGENGTCFSVIPLPAGRDNWQNAKDACATVDGYGKLATAIDVYDNAQFRVLLHQAYRTNNHSGHAWIGMQCHVHNFAWYNGCPVVYSNFLTMLPPGNNSDHCVAMNHDGKWIVQNCTDSAHYAVCEHRTEPCPAAFNITDSNMYCPVDFPTECSTMCYRVQTRSHQNNQSVHLDTFERAKQQCERMGGRLASIRNEEEQKCLEKYIHHSTEGMWIGLYEALDPSGQYVWKWEDEGAGFGFSSYTNWESGKPTNNSGLIYTAKRCAEMFPNGTWSNLACDSYDSRGMICEIHKVRSEMGRLTTSRPFGVTEPPTIPGISGGSVAGIVIGVLLGVAVVGGVAYVVITGKTGAMVGSVRHAGNRFKSTVAEKWSGNSRYDNDQNPVVNKDGYIGGGVYT
ncbi:macrophage mannose receptor 1-like isoform X1 [Paramacrobiotus metropolitanus]|uniref:macrophage mannose receptor 1-like isoform X1 n=2 Tax=Paramacrobiotus metropolitanus TaxID=2943436 RepID=UPI0024461318|nr:macrophage mannose receptor 1-like isoform X1 [Paramacrobiotus metropolitanus]